jgi:hypothetical protein
MEKKRVDLAYSVLGMVFFAIMVGMGAMLVYNVMQNVIGKH